MVASFFGDEGVVLWGGDGARLHSKYSLVIILDNHEFLFADT